MLPLPSLQNGGLAQLATRPYRTPARQSHSGGDTFGRGAQKQKMQCSVYILYSSEDQRYYVGISRNVNRRLAEHNQGTVRSTKPFVPWELVYQENHATMELARLREKYFKSAAGRRWRKKHLKPDMGD